MAYNNTGGPGYGGAQQGYGAVPRPGHPGGYPGGPQPGVPQPGGYPGGPQPGYPGAQQPGGPVAPPVPGTHPNIDPTIEAWFRAVDSDHSGRISVHELQQALMNGNWSCFNEETCRLLIGIFDKDLSGTIDMNEFSALWQYINQWKGAFDRFDTNKSGSIETMELHQAFTSMGFHVSLQFAQMVVVKFDIAARKGLNLDSFIQSCVMLRGLTDAFKQRDSNLVGSININYEDFMTLALSNKA